jgi:hypothetical protein
MTEINLYCDESGQMERDQVPVMVLGAISCPADRAARVARDLRRIKQKHGMGHGHPERFEVKWSKVSASRWSVTAVCIRSGFRTFADANASAGRAPSCAKERAIGW